METHWLFGKEKILGATVSKEGHANCLLGHEWTHHGATVNRAYYCQHLRQNSPYWLNDHCIYYIMWIDVCAQVSV